MSSEYCCLMNDLEFNQDGDLNLKTLILWFWSFFKKIIHMVFRFMLVVK